jgi:hypothetical protein
VRGWYESGVPGLSDYIFDAGASRGGQILISGYAAELAYHKGAQGVADWIDSVRARKDLAPTLVTHVHRKGIPEMAIADAEAAMAYCDIHCDEPYAEAARVRLVERLGMIGQADRTMAWIEASSDADPEDRAEAGRLAFRDLTRADREAAFAWADQAFVKYRNESWIQPIITFAIGARTLRDPEKALDWIDLLPEGQKREDALISIGRRWLKLDPPAAEAWLETSPLDDEAREKARTPIKWRNAPSRPVQRR